MDKIHQESLTAYLKILEEVVPSNKIYFLNQVIATIFKLSNENAALKEKLVEANSESKEKI